MENELKKFVAIQQMKNVEFLGFVDGVNKKNILARAQVLIFPSRCYESFGYTLIESYACGVPVVASDAGAAREMVDENLTGNLFKAGDAEDLENKVSGITENKIQLMEMKSRSLKKAKLHYTSATGFQNLIKTLDTLIGKR